jgi:hypothetical protein
MGTGTKLGLAFAALAVACLCIFILVAKPFATDAEPKGSLSVEAALYLDDAMLTLKKATVAFQNGDIVRAGKLYRSVETMPIVNAPDEVVSRDYLAYANNVRYYMIDDGSCTLKELEASRAQAEATIAAYQ